jgi:pimeloyl-ACP methyl ester carboxylesterase
VAKDESRVDWSAAFPGIAHGEVFREADGRRIRIHYWRTGTAGKPRLVLVHGFSDNGLCWLPVARELAADFDIVMPDLAGHGLSSRSSGMVRVDMAEDLACLVRELGLERPAIVGHSMGAMVSAQTVARRPDLASALVLEDPPWFMPGSVPGGDGGEAPVVTWAKTLGRRSEEELLAEYRRDHPSWTEELVRAMCGSKKQLDQAIVDELGNALVDGASTWPQVLGAISLPMLVFTGDPALGAIVNAEVAARIRSIRPDVRIVPVSGVGHLIRFDAHGKFVEALRPFLASATAR